jgi:phage/plasmid-associated DNA primase
LWTGFAIEPKDGECPLFLEHLEQVICSGNRSHFLYLLNLLALTCQEPGTPSEVAVVLRGEPGTGKGTFVRALGRIFGKHFAHLDKTSDLVGGFNAAISGKIIVFADEAFWAGDKKEVASLKRVITEPTLRITRKGIDSIEEANHMHLFMATNLAWSVPAQLKERRFLALAVSSARIGDHAYFDAIEDELRNGGLAAFLYGMLHRQIDRRLLRDVPKTRELRDQQGMSLSPELEWWQDCLFEGKIGGLGWPGGQWVPVSSIYAEYEEWNTKRKIRMLSKIEFGRRMSDYFTAQKNMARKVGGEILRCAHLFTIEEARKAFDTVMASPTEWPEATLTAPPPTIPF